MHPLRTDENQQWLFYGHITLNQDNQAHHPRKNQTKHTTANLGSCALERRDWTRCSGIDGLHGREGSSACRTVDSGAICIARRPGGVCRDCCRASRHEPNAWGAGGADGGVGGREMDLRDGGCCIEEGSRVGRWDGRTRRGPGCVGHWDGHSLGDWDGGIWSWCRCWCS